MSGGVALGGGRGLREEVYSVYSCMITMFVLPGSNAV